MAFIVGLPHEDKESIVATLKWLRTNWIDQVASANSLQIGTLDDYRSSTLSVDYLKHGYREMQDAIFPEYDFVNNIKNDNLLYKSEMMNKGVVWENDHMNVFEAATLAEKFQHGVYMVGNHSMERLDPFLLSNLLCHDDGTPLNLDEKLKLMAHLSGPYYDNYEKFVENYKRKKLDYKV
jgi:hypothetical protein